MPVVAGGARRGAAWLSAVLREGRGGARAMHGLERPAAHAGNHMPAMGEVGKVVSIISVNKYNHKCLIDQ